MDALREQKVTLPGGDRLTPHRFQSLGLGLGRADGLDDLHHLLEEAFIDGRPGRTELSEVFLRRVDACLSFAEHPLYALMHGPIYCQGRRPRGRRIGCAPNSRSSI